MTDYTITNGSTEKVIDRQEADLVQQDATDVLGYVIDVQGGDARLVDKDYLGHESQGVPILEGQALYGFDPMGREWHVFNDAASGSITVNVTPQRFRLRDAGGP